MANIVKKEESKLLSKRPLSLKNTLSISQPYDEVDKDKDKDKDSNFNKKRSKRRLISEWNVTEVPALPIFYINERTSVKIMNMNPQLIADRITQYANSISAGLNYDDLKGGAIISINRTEICVQLFRIRYSTQNAIIVEVRRKNGSSIIFHRAARGILSAAKGDPVALPPSDLRTMTRPDTTKLLRSKRQTKEEDDDTTAEAAIENIEDLLTKDRFDANLLGVESLLHLTSCGSSSKTMASFTADVILNGRSDIIKDKVFSLIVNAKRNEDEDDEPKNIVENGFNRRMRICVLSLLANALEVLSKSDLESKSSDEEWVGDDGLLASLLRKLKDSKSNVHEAYYAAKCLRTAIKVSSGMKSWAIERDVREIVQQSQNEGNCSRGNSLLGCVLDDILLCVETNDCKLNYKEI